VGRTGRAGKTGIAVTFVDWDDLHKWALINRALDFGQPEPLETYSSSPHLYEALNIPAGAKGRLRATPIKDAVAGGAPSRSGRSDSGRPDSGRGGRSTSARSGSGRSGAAGSQSASSQSAGSQSTSTDAVLVESSRTGTRERPERRTRTRTRVSQTTNPDAPEATPAAGTHDGGGVEHHDGNSAPRRRSRNRRRAPQAGTAGAV
ncbi:MAG: helicase, partial [Cryobacterium sp.]|nr:helicase [Cryobacterium sp.]